MKLNDFLESKGVVIKRNFHETIFENMESVLDKEVWICDYRCGEDIFKKPIRSISPKKVKIFDVNTTNKNVYYSPIYFREVKGDKVLNTIIAPCDNTGYRGRPGSSVNIFDTESECQRCYGKQLQDAQYQYDKEFNKIKTVYDEKTDWIMNELNGKKGGNYGN